MKRTFYTTNSCLSFPSRPMVITQRKDKLLGLPNPCAPINSTTAVEKVTFGLHKTTEQMS